jgi:hypothetical protein
LLLSPFATLSSWSSLSISYETASSVSVSKISCYTASVWGSQPLQICGNTYCFQSTHRAVY